MSSDFQKPDQADLAARLKASFGPAAAVDKKIWRLKPGETRDEILSQREEAVASFAKLQEMTSNAGVTLQEHPQRHGTYYLRLAEGQAEPEGWANEVRRNVVECLPADQDAFDEVYELRTKIAQRPEGPVEREILLHTSDMYKTADVNDEGTFESFRMMHEARDKVEVQILDNEVYVLNPAFNTYQHPDWELSSMYEYLSAAAREYAPKAAGSGPEKALKHG
jgi:hypothetical protein